ncbi:MAG: class I SAM-dependent methyltransferase [Candidatus Hydrogenedentes bacterium]|nr:class I SAM-dependent methyltransferase [Candidatus Hydrogenedentota bacterium]
MGAPEQTDYWNRVAGSKEFSLAVPVALVKERLDTDARILDVGCGYGRALCAIAGEGYTDLCGIDSAERMVAAARANLPSAEFKVNRGSDIPYEDARFDGVLVIGVLTCIPDDAAQARLVEEAARVLRPGGLLYVADFLLNDDERNRARYARFEDEFGTYGVFRLDEGVVVRHHAPQRIRALTAAFQEELFEEKTVRTMNGHFARGFDYIGRKRG